MQQQVGCFAVFVCRRSTSSVFVAVLSGVVGRQAPNEEKENVKNSNSKKTICDGPCYDEREDYCAIDLSKNEKKAMPTCCLPVSAQSFCTTYSKL
jgi:hypothetical protein